VGFWTFEFQVLAFGDIFENHGYISKPLIEFLNTWLCIYKKTVVIYGFQFFDNHPILGVVIQSFSLLKNLGGCGRFGFQVLISRQIFENHGYISKPIIGFLNAWLCIYENL